MVVVPVAVDLEPLEDEVAGVEEHDHVVPLLGPDAFDHGPTSVHADASDRHGHTGRAGLVFAKPEVAWIRVVTHDLDDIAQWLHTLPQPLAWIRSAGAPRSKQTG